MDSEQKYTEDDVIYEINEDFFENIDKFEVNVAGDIIAQIVLCVGKLPVVNGWSQTVAGVVTEEVSEPVYFTIDFLNQEDETPVLITLEKANSDIYLDYILTKNTIKDYLNEKGLPDDTSETEREDAQGDN
jgi:hypothetical protein